MNYYFNISDLKRRKRVIEKLLKNSSIHNTDIPKELEDDYFKICYLIDNTEDYYKLSDASNLEMDINNNRFFMDFDDYYSINDYFKTMLFDLNDNIMTFDDTEEDDLEYPILDASDDELIQLGYEIYSKLPNKKFLKLYRFYTDKKNDFLNIRHFEHDFDGIMAQTFPIYFPSYKPYFIINRCDTLSDLCSLCHEIAHGIYFAPNQPNGTCKRIDELSELEGHWFNFLTREYAKNVLNISNTEVAELYDFITINNDLISSIIMFIIYELNMNKNSIKLDEIEDELSKKKLLLHVDGEMLSEAFSISLATRIRYLSSYLISSDLEKLYISDPEKAFWDFEKIQQFKNYEDLKKLSKYDITCFEDGYKNFNEKYSPSRLC